MGISTFLRYVYAPVNFMYASGGAIGHRSKEWFTTHVGETDLWKNVGKPLYERKIKPLNHTDYALLGGGSVSSGTVVVVALKTFGIASLALAVGAAALLIFGAFATSNYRVNRHFDEEAWEHLDQIRRAANEVTYRNQQKFVVITEHKASLQQPQFSHREQQVFRGLEDELRKFRQIILSPSYEDKYTIVMTHIANLKTTFTGLKTALTLTNANDRIITTLDNDAAIITTLETELAKLRTNTQDLAAIEQQKQRLRHLQTNVVRDQHAPELIQQINELVAAAQGPSVEDSRKAFIAYLAGQQNLLSNKIVPDLLPPPVPPQANATNPPANATNPPANVNATNPPTDTTNQSTGS